MSHHARWECELNFIAVLITNVQAELPSSVVTTCQSLWVDLIVKQNS